jgi:hypothetical protein
MPSPPRRFSRALLGGLLLIGAAVLAAVLRWTTADAPDPSGELARANPGLKIAASVGGRVLVSAPDGADAVFMRATDAGPHKARLVSCAAVVTRLPAWFRLTADAEPTACLEIAADDGAVQVLNFLTAVGIPALWEEFYEPSVSAVGLGFHGASASGPGRETRGAPRSLSYAVDGPDGIDNAVSIDAFYRGDRTLVMVTLRWRAP